MKEIKELELNRYVIATLEDPTRYLISEHFGKYSFSENIQLASKTTTRNIAEEIRKYFYDDTNLNLDLVILPLKIEYKLVNEYE